MKFIICVVLTAIVVVLFWGLEKVRRSDNARAAMWQKSEWSHAVNHATGCRKYCESAGMVVGTLRYGDYSTCQCIAVVQKVSK